MTFWKYELLNVSLKSLTIITKSSTLDAAAVLDPPLVMLVISITQVKLELQPKPKVSVEVIAL